MQKHRYFEWSDAFRGFHLYSLCSTSVGPIELCGRIVVGKDGFQATVPVRERPNWLHPDDWKEVAWTPTLIGAKRRVAQEVTLMRKAEQMRREFLAHYETALDKVG